MLQDRERVLWDTQFEEMIYDYFYNRTTTVHKVHPNGTGITLLLILYYSYKMTLCFSEQKTELHNGIYFFDNIITVGFFPKITLPTEFTEQSSALIENIYSRLEGYKYICVVAWQKVL